MRAEIDAAFDAYPSERSRGDKDEFRYEMFNRSAACQARDRASAHPRGDRAAPRRRLPRDRQHRVEEPARFQGRSVALRCRAAHTPARGRRVARRDPVSGLRGRGSLHARRLRAGRRPDRGRARQPPLRPVAALRLDEEGRGDHLRRPPAATVRGRRRRRVSVRVGRLAPRPACAGWRSRPLLPAGALRAPRHRAADPDDGPGEPVLARGRCPGVDAAASASSSASTTRSSTTAERPLGDRRRRPRRGPDRRTSVRRKPRLRDVCK